jgi:hypothetical protein
MAVRIPLEVILNIEPEICNLFIGLFPLELVAALART